MSFTQRAFVNKNSNIDTEIKDVSYSGKMNCYIVQFETKDGYKFDVEYYGHNHYYISQETLNYIAK